MAGGSLDDAKKNKKDEFYTQLCDIENELKHYKEHFKDKVVFCNCDDPRESNFFKYFIRNFNRLGLKKLITTTYINSPIANTEDLFGERNVVYKVSINKLEDINDYDLITNELINKIVKKRAKKLFGDKKYKPGDFRSAECVELLKQADIVVTNPPFSLFREYVAQLIEYDKKFLIIGNVNAISYKEIFPLIKDNKLWLGISIHSGDREFKVPKDYPLNAAGFRTDEEGNNFIRVKGVRWFTNLEHKKRHEFLDLYKKYNPQEYPKYDNYDAINVDKTADIPCDYYEPMGVPITFLDKYSPEQFEILDMNPHFFTLVEQGFEKPKQLSLKSYGMKDPYARILIRKRNV